MTHGKSLAEWLYHKKWFILALALMLLAAWGIFSYLGMAQKPIESINITPAVNADKWRFTLADGTEVLPDENGAFALPEENAELFCTVSLEEYADRLTTSALLGLTARYCETTVFADGRLVADPKASGGSGLFTIGGKYGN